MRNKLIAAAALAVLSASAAYADTTPSNGPSATTPKPKVEAPVANVAAECQPVRFTRPDADPSKGHFMITIKGDTGAIKNCNPDLDVHQTPHGTGVVVTYGPDGVTINLPKSLASASASNGRCVNDEAGDVQDAVVYKASWSDGLPDHVDLQKLDPAFYNKKALMAVCQKLSAEHKFH